MANNPNRSLGPDEVVAFLSCSVRATNAALIDALDKHVFSPRGFRCVTIGRNVSSPQQVDDAVRALMNQAHCLLGVATARLDATERSAPDRSLALAAPYLLQEASMAYQCQIPHLIFKTPEVELQAVLRRNLWIEVRGDLSLPGKPIFLKSESHLDSALRDLKHLALERKRKLGKDKVWNAVSIASTVLVGGWGLGKLATWLGSSDSAAEHQHQDDNNDLFTHVLSFANHHRLGRVLKVAGYCVPTTKHKRIALIVASQPFNANLLDSCLAVDELRTACQSLNVDSTGTKKELIAELCPT